MRRCNNEMTDVTHKGSDFFAYSSEKSSTPPTQVTRALLSRVWKPVTIPNERPAQSPSPPRSAVSNRTSAPESESVSDAKLSLGALRIGTNRRLLRCATERDSREPHRRGVRCQEGMVGGHRYGDHAWWSVSEPRLFDIVNRSTVHGACGK